MAFRRFLIILSVLAGIGCTGAARADHAPAIAIPGKRGVPVIINGQDATGAVVIGDWGLYRPGHVAPTIIRRQPWPRLGTRHYRRPSVAVRHYRRKRVYAPRRQVRRVIVRSGARHFFPGGTAPPKLGRLESDVKDSAPPVPAESFSRSWSAGSSSAPATIAQPPIAVPPVVLDNRFRPKPKPPKP